MTDPRRAIDLFRQAADLNRNDTLRRGSLLEFPDYGQVVMTGDMHGHRRNFQKLVQYCHLEATPIRHVMLHELIHEEPITRTAHDHSAELLLDAAIWKTYFPDQVHFLQSNHELAQLHDHDITKGGRSVAADFDAGVADLLGLKLADQVLEAIDDFLMSLPAAGRAPNGIFFSHSLPNARELDRFNPNCIFDPPNQLDLEEDGDIYRLVWGRQHTPALFKKLARAWNVEFFLCGHQPREWGYEIVHNRMIILASDHNHGVFLPVDLKKRYTIDALESRIRKFAGVDLDGSAM